MDSLRDFSLLLLVYLLLLLPKWQGKSPYKQGLYTLTYAYITMVFYVTLMPFFVPYPGGNPDFLQSANLSPFIDLIKHHDGARKQILLNTLMMIPFGFLLPLIRKRNVLVCMWWSFYFSLCIETAQLLYVWSGQGVNRTFDVTDLITNTGGGVLGYLIYLLVRPFALGLFSRFWEPDEPKHNLKNIIKKM